MALKFKCPNCNWPTVTRYLSVGEVAECKKCRKRVVIPQDAITFSAIDESLPKNTHDKNSGENHVLTEVEIKSPSSPSDKWSATAMKVFSYSITFLFAFTAIVFI